MEQGAGGGGTAYKKGLGVFVSGIIATPTDPTGVTLSGYTDLNAPLADFYPSAHPTTFTSTDAGDQCQHMIDLVALGGVQFHFGDQTF